MPIVKDAAPIRSLEDWRVRAGPKADYQWADGRSAKEAARAWLQGDGVSMPAEVEAALSEHPAFGPPLNWLAEPEAKLRFDSFSGEPRNSDLAVVVEDRRGSYLLAVEAKADEPFGETVEAALLAALDRKSSNPRSNGIARIEQLLTAFLSGSDASLTPARSLRYQLLTAAAGALCEAERRGYSRALVLVHEFVTPRTEDLKHERNAGDLQAFMARISAGRITKVASGQIYGPIRVPGVPLLNSAVDLYAGKVRRVLR